MISSNILIVEDERIVAKDIKASLQSLGYAVPALVASGEEAIKKAAEFCPDLVLMDIHLEGDMDGVEAAEQIYTRFNIPIIYLTAHSDVNTLQRAKAIGPFGYIVKPFEEQDLLTTIETALQRYQLEKKLKESEQWWATTLRSVGDAVIATDATGGIKFLNPVAEALTGWKQNDAEGRDVTEVLSLINEKTRASIKNPVTGVLQKSAVVCLEDDTLLIAKDKTEIPIDDSAAPIKDSQGNLSGVVVVFRDISERKQAEAALRQANEKLIAMERQQLQEALGRSQNRWHAIIDTEPECVMLVDSDGGLLEINAAGLAILEAESVDSVTGESVYSLVATEYRKAFQTLNESVCKGNKGTLEFEIVGYRGTRRWMEAHAVPLANELDRTLVQFAIMRDITERKRVEETLRKSEQAAIAQVEELEKLNRLKDEFLSTVSHELRTPITNIKMALQMLTLCLEPLSTGCKATAAESYKIKRYLRVLQDECERETSLINDLLDLQRLDAEIEPLDLETICLETWLHQVAEPFQERVRTQNQTFRLELPKILPSLLSNQASLERVLAELLNNACKYTPSGERITLKAFVQTSTIQLQVINSGVEIPEREIPRIFDKFYRVLSTDPWKQGGTGLGLALVQKLTELLGGTIWVESYSSQTCFTIELPFKPS